MQTIALSAVTTEDLLSTIQNAQQPTASFILAICELARRKGAPGAWRSWSILSIDHLLITFRCQGGGTRSETFASCVRRCGLEHAMYYLSRQATLGFGKPIF